MSIEKMLNTSACLPVLYKVNKTKAKKIKRAGKKISCSFPNLT